MVAALAFGWTAHGAPAQEPDPAATPAPAVTAEPPAPEPTVAPAEPTPAATIEPRDEPAVVPTPAPVAAPAQTPVAAPAQTPVPTPEPTPAPPVEPAPAPPAAPVEADPCVFENLHGCTIRQSQCTKLGTIDADVIMGEATQDLICGLGGNDVIDGGGGDDLVIGGDGDDTITGGAGTDCMIGDDGADTFTDTAPDEFAIDSVDELFIIEIDEDLTCTQQTFGGNVGGVEQTIEGGSIILTVAQIVDDGQPSSSPFPVSLARAALVRDGIARVVMRCPGAAASGTLTLTTRKPRRRAGRADFECEGGLETIEVTLADTARETVEDRGELAVRVRIDVDGRSEAGQARLTLRSEG